MIFPYLRYKSPDGYLEILPVVFVRLACNRKHQAVLAIIDSGADISVFNADIAKIEYRYPERTALRSERLCGWRR